ncbi:MAG: hypothetical protein KA436_12005 [Oligoflexales bacterium]|nr:hypothetical protein [Oligoflexales bacterium]
MKCLRDIYFSATFLRFPFFIITLFACNLPHKKAEIKSENPSLKKKSEVIADLDRNSIKPQETISGVELFSDMFNENMKQLGMMEKMLLGYGLQNIVDPIGKVLGTFLSKDTRFRCKTDHLEDSKDLNCEIKNKNNFLFNLRVYKNSEALWLHTCKASSDAVMIEKSDDEFWSYLTKLANNHDKNSLYGDKEKLPLHGVLIHFKNYSGSWQVADFKASIGPVEPGSEEYEEFLAPTCEYYHDEARSDVNQKI